MTASPGPTEFGVTSTSGLRPAEIRHYLIGGQEIRTARWRGTGEHRPLLFFNGIGANLEIVTPLAEALPSRDLVAFDAPGIGGSGPARWPYRLWMLSRLVKRVLDRMGIAEVDAMGVSWGGAAAQQFAFQYTRRVKRLILAATSAGMVMVPGNPSALMRMWHPGRYLDPSYMMRHFERLYGDDPAGAAGHAVGLKAPSIKGYVFQMLAGLGWTSLPFLPLIRQPTLVLMGDRDRIVPAINGRLLARLIPDARLHIIKGGGHLFLVSRAAETLPLIRGFLGEEEVSPAAGAR